MGKVDRNWQERDYILNMFGDELQVARRGYPQFVVDGVAKGKRQDLVGGGLIRSQAGWSAVQELGGREAYQKGDERILGESDFVGEVLRESEEKFERKYHLKAQSAVRRGKEVAELNHYALIG